MPFHTDHQVVAYEEVSEVSTHTIVQVVLSQSVVVIYQCCSLVVQLVVHAAYDDWLTDCYRLLQCDNTGLLGTMGKVDL